MIERWDIYEIELNGPSAGNPFVDVQLSTRFQLDDCVVELQGFYDGEGLYRIRFMPDTVGQWHFVTQTTFQNLTVKRDNLSVSSHQRVTTGQCI